MTPRDRRNQPNLASSGFGDFGIMGNFLDFQTEGWVFAEITEQPDGDTYPGFSGEQRVPMPGGTWAAPDATLGTTLTFDNGSTSGTPRSPIYPLNTDDAPFEIGTIVFLVRGYNKADEAAGGSGQEWVAIASTGDGSLTLIGIVSNSPTLVNSCNYYDSIHLTFDPAKSGGCDVEINEAVWMTPRTCGTPVPSAEYWCKRIASVTVDGVTRPTYVGIVRADCCDCTTDLVGDIGYDCTFQIIGDSCVAGVFKRRTLTICLDHKVAYTLTEEDAPNCGVANLTMMSNVSGGTASPIPNTTTQYFDVTASSTPGTVFGRNSSAWGAMATAAHTLLGNPTGSTANVGVVSVGATFAFASTTLQTVAMTGDVTSSANSFATTIAAHAVTAAKFRQSAANTLVGNPTGSTADVVDIGLGAGLEFAGGLLTATGTSSGTASIGIEDNSGTRVGLEPNLQFLDLAPVMWAITDDGSNSRVQVQPLLTGAAHTLLANPTGSTGSYAATTVGATFAFSGTALQTVAMTGDITSSANSFATTLATVNSNVGTFGAADHTLTVTANAKGLITAISSALIAISYTQVSGLATVAHSGDAGDLTGTLPVAHGGTSLTTLTAHAVYVGNGTSAPTSLGVASTNTVLHGNTGADPSFSAVVEADITLANNTTNDVSTSKHGFTPILPNDATKFLNGVGGYTAPAGSTYSADESTLHLSGTTFSIISTYVGQTSITTVGTIATGTWAGTTIAIAHGGTGQTTAAAAFNALSPMTTLGDTIYGGTSGAGTRLAGNTSATPKLLRQDGTGSVSAAPTWSTLLAMLIASIGTGTSGQVLVSDGAGGASWKTLSIGGSPTFSGTLTDCGTGAISGSISGLSITET